MDRRIAFRLGERASEFFEQLRYERASLPWPVQNKTHPTSWNSHRLGRSPALAGEPINVGRHLPFTIVGSRVRVHEPAGS